MNGMIYQLSRRDCAGRMIPWATIFATGFGWWIARYSPHSVTAASGAMLFMMLTMAQPFRRATAFEASLPIEARDLFWSRTISILALIWLPVAALMAVVSASGELPSQTALSLWNAGLLFSAGSLKFLGDRPKQLGVRPKWTIFTFLLGIVGVSLLDVAEPVIGELTGVAMAVAAMLLLVRAWRGVPAWYQLAPEEAAVAPVRTPRGGTVWPPRLFLFRLLISWQATSGVFFCCVAAWGAAWKFVPFGVAIYLVSTVHRLVLPLSLPISTRRLLWTHLAPLAAPMAALTVIAPYLKGIDPSMTMRMGLLAAAFGFALVLLSALFVFVNLHHRVQRLPITLRITLGLPLIIPALWGYASPLKTDPLQLSLVRISTALPENLLATCALVLLVLLILGWFLEKAFDRAEFHGKILEPQRTAWQALQKN